MKTGAPYLLSSTKFASSRRESLEELCHVLEKVGRRLGDQSSLNGINTCVCLRDVNLGPTTGLKFNVMLFSLYNALAIFERLMEIVKRLHEKVSTKYWSVVKRIGCQADKINFQ